MMSGQAPLSIGYVLSEFPSATETFVANEIRGLMDCGACVSVFSLRRGDGRGEAPCPVFYRSARDNYSRRGALRAMARLAGQALKLESRSPADLARALRNVGAAFRFSRIVRRLGIAHLHAHFAFIPTDVALMIARLEPVSVSFSAHAWDVYCYCAGRSFPAKLRRAGLCITCTAANRRHLTSLADRADRERIVHIYHGADLDRFRFEPCLETSTPPRILAVGRLVPKKGFETLLRACRRLRETMACRCEIVGEGPLGPKLKALARELGLADAVAFRGLLPHDEMPDAYAGADVLAAPSVQAPNGDRDGLPNVVVEAMACGVPVVASRISGIPEAIQDTRTGLLCPPGDSEGLAAALRRMLTDGPLRSRCVGRARRAVEEKFDAARNSQLVFEAIRDVAGRKAPRG